MKSIETRYGDFKKQFGYSERVPINESRPESVEYGYDDGALNFDNLQDNGNLTIVDLAIRCATDEGALLLLEEFRWGGKPTCAHCGSRSVHYVEPSNGKTRANAAGNQSARRVWKCHKRGGGCGKQFSVTVGTIMHRTKLPIRHWLSIMFEMAASKNGVAAREIQRKYKISQKSAWHILHRIREAMSQDETLPPMVGRIAVDETYVGGRVPKMNKARKAAFRQQNPSSASYMGSTGVLGKTPVVTLINRDTGEVRSRVMNDVTKDTLAKHLSNQTVKERSHLETDSLPAYKKIGAEFVSHARVDHSQQIYAVGNASTNVVESYFSQLKRSLDGTHHHCSSVHLQRYVGEFDYRYTTRKMTDSDRLRDLVSRPNFERPLPYKKLIGE